ncbi:unnamed protein product [Hermetia illucens]|uniref:NIF3-like protein 1 n=2 Tax=Hermetia illucens TaxID=343691 RepID=A0A7R8YY79_HERIL|nr:unnamed protein product [Hermetia illucens]
MSGLGLQEVVSKLEEFAPLKLAGSWDNVGLLIEPSAPKSVENVFLTNDLTEKVLEEAIGQKADLVISYHPPIFASLKRITQKTWKERLVATCLEKRIALYSPHTSWDSIRGGICDWLCDSLPHASTTPITPDVENEENGLGRFLTIHGNLTLADAIKRIKEHTGIKNVHVAIGVDSNLETNIKTVAVCAGSGASVLKPAAADLFLTGEMSHHEVLDCTQRNISVILCNHSNSERGYLKVFKSKLESSLSNKVKVSVSTVDADPLETY